MTGKLKVACVQNNAAGTHEANIAAALKLTRAAFEQGAELVSLPEYVSGFGSKNGRLDVPAFPEAEHPAAAHLPREPERLRVGELKRTGQWPQPGERHEQHAAVQVAMERLGGQTLQEGNFA